MELDFVLRDYVDSDALEQLVERATDPVSVHFDVPGHSVTATEAGIVVDGSPS
jgi:hypothetical protein